MIMREKIQLCYKNLFNFCSKPEFAVYVEKAKIACRTVQNGDGAGADMLGWRTLPSAVTVETMNEIKHCADALRAKCEIVVVIGIGGSYLGARAVVEALTNSLTSTSPRILWAGNNLSGEYAYELSEILAVKEFGVVVISKSGTTLEPALAFRYVREILENKYGREEAARRIIAITDEKKGVLRELVRTEGYTSFVIPDNVGGRFSVLTPVGLLPIAIAGIDIEAIVNGALAVETNVPEDVIHYAAIRNMMYEGGKKIELLATFEPKLDSFTEWWKQLFGESEGKNGGGLFPANVIYSADLHSMGQYVQDGERILFETFLSIEKSRRDLLIKEDPKSLDGLNYIAGKSIGEINRLALQGVALAHADGGVPNITIKMEELNAETIGALIYFFEYACAVSAYMLNINPFDQDGVERYKENMFALMNKPGFEEIGEKIKKRL